MSYPKKDFWNKTILFLSDGIQAFSLDNVSTLKKYAIEQTCASRRNTVEYKIDRHQKPTVEQIYEVIAFVMGTFGNQIEDSDNALADIKLIYAARRGMRARGVYRGETFDVLEESPEDPEGATKAQPIRGDAQGAAGVRRSRR